MLPEEIEKAISEAEKQLEDLGKQRKELRDTINALKKLLHIMQQPGIPGL